MFFKENTGKNILITRTVLIAETVKSGTLSLIQRILHRIHAHRIRVRPSIVLSAVGDPVPK